MPIINKSHGTVDVDVTELVRVALDITVVTVVVLLSKKLKTMLKSF